MITDRDVNRFANPSGVPFDVIRCQLSVTIRGCILSRSKVDKYRHGESQSSKSRPRMSHRKAGSKQVQAHTSGKYGLAAHSLPSTSFAFNGSNASNSGDSG